MEFAVEGCPHKAKKMLDSKEGMWKENIFVPDYMLSSLRRTLLDIKMNVLQYNYNFIKSKCLSPIKL